MNEAELRDESNTKTTKSRGDRIERMAREWWEFQYPEVSGKKVRILYENYRSKFGEIDLIAEEVENRSGHAERIELVMIEVRSRAKGSWVSGLESVTFPKQLRLRKVIAQFLARYRGKAQSVRCDVMEWDGVKLVHFPDAWRIS